MEEYEKHSPYFGCWYIKKQIGKGSFGRVFEIERKEFGHSYYAALKIITVPEDRSEINSRLSDGYTLSEIQNYFRSCVQDIVGEFELMSQLKGHSNIVSYEDHQVLEHVDHMGWDILIRMELLTPLNTYMQKKPFSPYDAARLGIDMCKALELCQRYQIIHRDIKPDNIFVSDTGDFKLGDFGIARIQEKTSAMYSKKGTWTYMAPEVYQGKEYGAGVDLYAVGLVLYRLLNKNRMPFLPQPPEPVTYRAEEQALADRMNGKKLPDPCEADPVLAGIIRKATAFEPALRYESPGRMRENLEAVLEKEGKNPLYSSRNEAHSDMGFYPGDDGKTVVDTGREIFPSDETLVNPEPGFKNGSIRKEEQPSGNIADGGCGRNKRKKKMLLAGACGIFFILLFAVGAVYVYLSGSARGIQAGKYQAAVTEIYSEEEAGREESLQTLEAAAEETVQEEDPFVEIPLNEGAALFEDMGIPDIMAVTGEPCTQLLRNRSTNVFYACFEAGQLAGEPCALYVDALEEAGLRFRPVESALERAWWQKNNPDGSYSFIGYYQFQGEEKGILLKTGMQGEGIDYLMAGDISQFFLTWDSIFTQDIYSVDFAGQNYEDGVNVVYDEDLQMELVSAENGLKYYLYAAYVYEQSEDGTGIFVQSLAGNAGEGSVVLDPLSFVAGSGEEKYLLEEQYLLDLEEDSEKEGLEEITLPYELLPGKLYYYNMVFRVPPDTDMIDIYMMNQNNYEAAGPIYKTTLDLEEY